MARVTKEHKVRRNEILDTAQNLFYTIGYNEVSVNCIINQIGISKGTFYHYFKSKEELLDQLVERFSAAIIEIILPILEDDSQDALSKLNLIYKTTSTFKFGQVDIMRTIINVMYSDSNILMRHKLRTTGINAALPIFTKILESGSGSGIFTIDDPEKTAELILMMGNSLTDKTALLFKNSASNPRAKDELLLYLKTYQQCIEKILGIPENSLQIYEEAALLEFLEGFAK